MKKIKAAILGPTGYSGLELIRILLRHPRAEIVYLGSRREERPRIDDIWPQLRGLIDLQCASMDPAEMPADIGVVFAALPHGVVTQYVPALCARGFRVVDISADYRIKDQALYEKTYGVKHGDPEGLKQAVYGLTELNRDEIAGAQVVANPGCYPTSVALAAAPLLESGLVEAGAPVIADSKSGISGAGKEPGPTTHYPECNESIAAYKVGSHRHAPEIAQTLAEIAGRPCELVFTPHLTPMDRGILSTLYLRLNEPADTKALTALFAEYYAEDFFVRVRSDGSQPRTKDVWGANFCDIAVVAVGRTAVVTAVIDNLVKGASGQAVQNMNVMFGLDEKAGLL